MRPAFSSAILHVVKKELIQTFRDPRMLMILLVAPAVQVTVFGYAVNLDLASQPTVVADLDRTRASREATAAIANETSFEVVEYVESYEQAEAAVTSGEAALAVLIPRGFEAALADGRAEIMVALDASDANTALRAGQAASQILVARAIAVQQDRLADALASMGVAPESVRAGVRIDARPWFNPEMRTSFFLVPAVLGLVLTVITTMLTAMGLTREKEMGTLEQVMVTPLGPMELMVGKVTPFALVGLVDVAFVVSVAALVFGLPVRGSMAGLFFASALFLFTTLGTGLFISTVSGTQQQAMLNTFFFVLPAIMLSGYIYPIENMPVAVQYVTYANPLRYYLELTRGIMVKGASLADLWQSLVLLAVLGGAVLVGAARRFHKRIA